MRGKRPASLDDPSIPRFAAEMLAKCWSTEPGSRPTMTWCSEFFPWQTAKLFNACYGCNLDRIPPSHKSEGDGWCAVRNPASPRTYEFRFASKHLQSRCVVRPCSCFDLFRFLNICASLRPKNAVYSGHVVSPSLLIDEALFSQRGKV